MRKGQGALEYLTTYGIALLIIVIAIAALFALGLLNPASYQRETCTGFQYFTYVSHVLNDDSGGFDIVLRNGNQDVNISSVTFANTGIGGLSLNTIKAGNSSFLIGGSADVTSSTEGSTYSEAVVVSYSLSASGLSKTDRASCTGIVA